MSVSDTLRHILNPDGFMNELVNSALTPGELFGFMNDLVNRVVTPGELVGDIL